MKTNTAQSLNSINSFIHYDMILGEFYTMKDNKIIRRIFPDEEGYLIFYRNGSRLKLRANKVAMELITSEKLPKGKVILHKNLDKTDYRLQNLAVVSKVVFNKIKEASRNLLGALKMTPHSTDVFSYVLSWKESNKDRKLVINDVVIAKKVFNKLQLKYSKILSKYCLFD